jgi:hypothetical protein
MPRGMQPKHGELLYIKNIINKCAGLDGSLNGSHFLSLGRQMCYFSGEFPGRREVKRTVRQDAE